MIRKPTILASFLLWDPIGEEMLTAYVSIRQRLLLLNHLGTVCRISSTTG